MTASPERSQSATRRRQHEGNRFTLQSREAVVVSNGTAIHFATPVEPTISALIASTDAGDRSAADALFSALYAERHELARRQLAGSGRGVTLGPTTLLHEAYLNMSRREGPEFPDRARFMGYAARVMRGLVIDHARRRAAQKRGAGFRI